MITAKMMSRQHNLLETHDIHVKIHDIWGYLESIGCFSTVWMSNKRTPECVECWFHDLRHQDVSRFAEAGLSDQDMSTISGHKSMQMAKR